MLGRAWEAFGVQGFGFCCALRSKPFSGSGFRGFGLSGFWAFGLLPSWPRSGGLNTSFDSDDLTRPEWALVNGVILSYHNKEAIFSSIAASYGKVN